MPSSADDATGDALRNAAEAIQHAVGLSAAAHPIVLIDGRSGSGKTTLAACVADGWRRSDVPVILALDAVYPGWDGLAAGAQHMHDAVLVPHAAGCEGAWTAWDWHADAPANAHTVVPSATLIVEGCGILTPHSRALADVTVWLESPAVERKRRALTRDGESYRPHWEQWAAQEDEHIQRNDPRALADIVVSVP